MSMSRATTVVVAGICLMSASSASAQPVDNSGKFFHSTPSGYVAAGAVVLKRNGPDAGTIVAANPGGTPFMTGDNLKFGWDAGIDATIGVRFLDRHAIEVRYLHFETDASHQFITPGNFIGAGFTGPGGTLFSSQYDTTLRNAEVNWRYQVFEQFAVLAGLRAIDVKDRLKIVLNNNVATGLYTYSNSLRGAQVGVEWMIFHPSSPFQINILGKIGRYSLDTFGGIDEFQGNNFIGGFTGSLSDTVLASELGVSVGYRLGNNVTLRAGYQALWINDIGIASTAASVSLLNPSLLRQVQRDDLFLQGITFGMNITW